MKILKVESKRHGLFEVKLDEEGYRKISTLKNLRWCVRICKRRNNLYYFQKRMANDKLIELHRFLLDAKQGQIVDHINGDTLDNRIKNLQFVTNSANIRKGRIRTNNTSGITGIWFDQDRKRWGARIRVMYKTIHLGRFKKKSEAVIARKRAELEYKHI